MVDMTGAKNRLSLIGEGLPHTIEWESNDRRTPLQLLPELLSLAGKNVDEISEIEVVPGPGDRFTRTRSSVVFANALAAALQIPVNNKPFELPIYHQEPNITLKK